MLTSHFLWCHEILEILAKCIVFQKIPTVCGFLANIKCGQKVTFYVADLVTPMYGSEEATTGVTHRATIFGYFGHIILKWYIATDNGERYHNLGELLRHNPRGRLTPLVTRDSTRTRPRWLGLDRVSTADDSRLDSDSAPMSRQQLWF